MSEKYCKEFDGQLVCCMIEGIGLVTGKMKEKVSGIPFIRNPRIIQFKQVGDKQPATEMKFVEMIGSPDELILVRPPVFIYEMMSKEGKESWNRSTSNLVVPGGSSLGVVK